MRVMKSLVLAVLMAAAAAGFTGRPALAQQVELARLGLDDPAALGTVISLDQDNHVEGGGSVLIKTKGPVTVCLGEVAGLDVEGSKVTYQAQVKSKEFTGNAFLEMWCYMPDGNAYFSRGLHSMITGEQDWTRLETLFIIQKGQRPVRFTLNIYVNGTGEVWVDDIRFSKGPLD